MSHRSILEFECEDTLTPQGVVTPRSAAANNVSSVEISGQRLILQRNGSPILLDGSRYPRLMKIKPAEKLEEVLEMLRNF